MRLLVKNAQIVNPQESKEADILIENGRIIRIDREIESKGNHILDVKGKYVLPGFIDMHTHLRTPGREDEETLYTGSQAAVKGGFTTILCMPNTEPAIDNYELALRISQEAKKIGLVDIFPVGAITYKREGKQLTEFNQLKKAGCLALSEDGLPLKNTQLLRRALEYAKMLGLLIISHCEEVSLSQDGVVRESEFSSRWGLPPFPEVSESIGVAREIELARYLESRIHLAHISSEASLRLIREAKKEGVRVTAETAPHYFTFSVEDIEEEFNTNLKVKPPLGTKKDIEALKQALQEDVIDCIATDHAPHTYSEKEVSFYEASSGMIGLEFAFSLGLNLFREGRLTLNHLVEKFSSSPAKILGLNDRGVIREGKRADLTVIDTQKSWVVKEEEIFSKSKNTPLIGKTLQGKVLYTIYKGKIVYSSEEELGLIP